MPLSCAAARASARAVSDVDQPVERNRTLGQHAIERLALHELHGEKVHGRAGVGRLHLFDGIHGHDAGVIEGGEGLGFLTEAGETLRVVGEHGGQHLERHGAPKLGVGGAVDLAHRASTQQPVQFVVAQPPARSHGS